MNAMPRIRSPKRGSWLCVAYAFPPINRSGTHRTLGFVKHLERIGWDATVVTVEPGEEPVDDSLGEQVPPSTTVIRTSWTNYIERLKRATAIRRFRPQVARVACRTLYRAGGPSAGFAPPVTRGVTRTLREWVSHLLITPDSRIGWVLPAVRAAMKTIRERRPEVVYSTSPYASAHLIALLASQRTRLPWVADLRDPWGDNPFGASGFPSLRRWDNWLERLVMHRATHIICSTPTLQRRLGERLPFTAGKCSTIPNGFDGETIRAAKPKRIAPAGEFVLTHCGQFYGPRSPAPWFAAVRRVLERAPELEDKIHLLLIGPKHYKGRHLAELANEAGVGRCVHVLGEKGHAETLSFMAGSDAMMLAGSAGTDAELQVPGKLFEYLAMRKPIIATAATGSPVVGILEQARAEAAVCAPNDRSALADAISSLTCRCRPGGGAGGHIPARGFGTQPSTGARNRIRNGPRNLRRPLVGLRQNGHSP